MGRNDGEALKFREGMGETNGLIDLESVDTSELLQTESALLYGPAPQQCRREWTFKRRHIENMSLGKLCFSLT